MQNFATKVDCGIAITEDLNMFGTLLKFTASKEWLMA